MWCTALRGLPDSVHDLLDATISTKSPGTIHRRRVLQPAGDCYELWVPKGIDKPVSEYSGFNKKSMQASRPTRGSKISIFA